VRTREHLYVETLHPGCWRLDHEQLYEIERDPQMTVDLLAVPAGASGTAGTFGPPGGERATSDPKRVATELAGALEGWREEHLTLRDPFPDPMEARRYEGPADAFHVPCYEKRLARTGRQHLAEDLERRLHSEWVTRARW
jgi:hypothetical protein